MQLHDNRPTGYLNESFRQDSSPLIIDARRGSEVYVHDRYGRRLDAITLKCSCEPIELRYTQDRKKQRTVWSICQEHGLTRLGTAEPAKPSTAELMNRWAA